MNVASWTCALALLPILSFGATAPPTRQPVVVVYMLGQSNCWGYGSTNSQVTEPAYGESVEGAYIWSKIADNAPHAPADNGMWKPLTTGYGFQRPPGSNPDAIGSEMELAFRLRTMYELPVYIIKVTRGGSSLFEDRNSLDWSTESSGELLDAWRLAYHRPAIEALYAQGKTPHLVGILWAQGAADASAEAPESASRLYPQNLRKLFDELRSEIGVTAAPIAIQRETNLEPGPYPNLGRVRHAQMSVGNSDENCAWFDSDTRQLEGEALFEKLDDEHFDGNGQVDMGRETAVTFRSVIDGHPLPIVPRPVSAGDPPPVVQGPDQN